MVRSGAPVGRGDKSQQAPPQSTGADRDVEEIPRGPVAAEAPRLLRTFNIDAREGHVELVEEAEAHQQFEGLSSTLEIMKKQADVSFLFIFGFLLIAALWCFSHRLLAGASENHRVPE